MSPSDLLALIFDPQNPLEETRINPDWADPNFNWDSMFSPGHYPCLERGGCNATFSSMKKLTNHLKNSHPPLEAPFFCPCLNTAIQAKSPDFEGSLPLHYSTLVAWHYRAHQRDPEGLISKQATADDQSEPSSPAFYQQTTPEQEVGLRRSTRKRKAPQSYNDFCSDDETEEDSPRIKRHCQKTVSRQNPITCCGRTYCDRSSLRFHEESQHSDIDFSCPYCKNPLTAGSSLLLHLRSKHSEKRSPDKLICRVNGCQRDIHWEPMRTIHEAKCRAKLKANLPNHEGEESTGDPDDL